MNGKPMPESYTKGQRIAQLTVQKLNCVGTKFKFQRHGKSGAEISELLPHISKISDEIAIVRSLHTEAINHDPGVTMMQTGSTQADRPSIGSWLSYGLGSENDQLPAFVVLTSRVSSFGRRANRFCSSRTQKGSTTEFAAGCSTACVT